MELEANVRADRITPIGYRCFSPSGKRLVEAQQQAPPRIREDCCGFNSKSDRLLGCGNARYLAPCLRRVPPATYEGVDLSEAALAEARGYLAELPGQITLTLGDLLQAVESTGKTWDVLFTGFAIHHLMPDDKKRFFRAAGRCLSEKGWLILVDVLREENQNRKSYLDGYLKFMRETWTKVSTAIQN